MNILTITGPIFPQTGNNANLTAKLLAVIQKQHNVQVLGFSASTDRGALPESFAGARARWCVDDRRDNLHRLVYPAYAFLTDHNGYSDALTSRLMLDEDGRTP